MQIVESNQQEATKYAQVEEVSVPMALLEIFVSGVEADKPQIKKLNDKLQKQMDSCPNGKYCRILWYVDAGEKTPEQKKEWFLENAKSRYQLYTPETYVVNKDFVKIALQRIKKFEDSIKDVVNYGILRNKK